MSRVFNHLRIALLLGPCFLSGLLAQEPVRPPSDSSVAKPDQSGTNYLRQNLGKQINTQGLQELLREKQRSETATHTIAPTSDKSNKSEKARFMALMEQINPALVQVGELESYTNYQIVRPNVEAQHYTVTTPSGTTPAMIRKIYNLNSAVGSGVIAIVDAYHYPDAAGDLAKFSSTFGLPVLPTCPDGNSFGSGPACLKIEPQSGSSVNCGWNAEAALDLEWAHAIAPGASLLLVEAASNQNADLYAAVARARDEIAAVHGQLSMSWGTAGEAATTATYGSTFTDGVLYFAATGDSGGQLGFPAAFPNVIAVGGTVLLYQNDGTLLAEYGWPDSGGGVSALEKPAPPYQAGVENVNPAGRNTPDIAAVSDGNPAVAVFVSTPVAQCQDHPSPEQYQAGWTQLVGTSLATPVVAAMVNAAGRGRTTVADELKAIYANRKNPSRIRDIMVMDGSAGGNTTKVGYDNVTGVGTPASLDFDAN